MFTLYKDSNKENGRLFAVINDVRDYLESVFHIDSGDFDYLLDDVYDDVTVLDKKYELSYVLKLIDKNKYDMIRQQYTQSLINDAIYELERTGEATIGDYQIVEEEDED